MKQYIDKSALVAEFNRLITELVEEGEDTMFEQGRISAFEDAKLFIETLEVKEVDLQSEIDRAWDNTSDNFSEDGWKEFENIAKHFFELGLKTQHSNIDFQNLDDLLEEEGVDPTSKDAKIFKESYYMALEKLKEKIV